MIHFILNGEKVAFDADPEMPLLWALRERFQLTGTKFGCGKALCGACTAHLDGGAVRTCVVPMAAVEGRSVTTIEGLDEQGMHPVQRAWRQNNVPQCGFCQSGQIMAAAALLAENPKPTEQEVRVAMSGNLCRCGTYPRIIKAIVEASTENREGLPE